MARPAGAAGGNAERQRADGAPGGRPTRDRAAASARFRRAAHWSWRAAVSLRVLVVGDRFIPSALYAEAAQQAAAEHQLDITLDGLDLPYPAADRLPLPESEQGADFRPLWEDPAEMIRRAEDDLAADPDLREYTGP